MHNSGARIFFISVTSNPALTKLSEGVTTETTKDLFSSPLYYIFPVALIIYTIIIAIASNFEVISKVKRIYYAIMSLLFIFVLKNVDFMWVSKEGLWGTTPKAWSLILVSIIGMILIVLIDSYIISGYVFKEFGFFGTKFIRDETTETVKSQHDYIFSLESSIKAQFELIDKTKKDMADSGKLKIKKLNFNEQIEKIISGFYALKNTETQVEAYNFKKGDYNLVVDKLTNDYNLNLYQIIKLKSRLKNNLLYYLKIKGCDYNMLHVVITSEFAPDFEIGIAIKLYGECNLHDQYIIKNIIYYYELELIKLKKRSNSCQ